MASSRNKGQRVYPERTWAPTETAESGELLVSTEGDGPAGEMTSLFVRVTIRLEDAVIRFVAATSVDVLST
jgi:hypothetical protein